jgi:hypothetical protein
MLHHLRLPRLSLHLPEPGLRAWWRRRFEGHSRYVVFRQELAYWDRRLGGRWRLDEPLALLTLANLCLLPAALLIAPALLLAYALLDEILGMALTLPAALTVAREREQQTWEVLRATPISGQDLALGKLSGLLYLVWDGAVYLTRARWYGTWLALPLFALMLTVRHPYPLAADLPPWLSGGLLAAAYALFISRPCLNLLYGGCLGLAISTASPSTNTALTLATVITGLTGVALGVAWALFAQAGSAALLFSESVLGVRLEGIFFWLLPPAGLSLARLLLTPVLLIFAARRIPHLSG